MPSRNFQPVKPPPLGLGDTIGIVAPASNVNQAELESGCESLRRAGYCPVYFDSIFERDLYFAGSPRRRARELEEMFERDDIRGIICARGGYGANYLLKHLDLSKIKAHPKIFVGYSDITTLLTYVTDATGVVTFHGPMAAKDWTHKDGVDAAAWQSALSGSSGWDVPLNQGVAALLDGEAEGVLYGGCLSILVASLDTPYAIKTEGTILFLEDVGAKPYQIDRMLMQMKLAGQLDSVRGIIFGEMLDCVQTSNQGYTLEEVITRIVAELNVPVIYGVRSGHVSSNNITLPFGVKARLSVRQNQISLKILEPSVRT